MPPPGLVHHSDRGVQCACGAFRDRLAAHAVTASMSRRANPYDNALVESFVSTLNAECFAGQILSTKAAARLLVFDYIETFYNPRRRHSSLGYLSRRDFKNKCPPKQKPLTSTPKHILKVQPAFSRKDQSALQTPFHRDERLLGEPGGTLVSRAY
jgi:hypothetical protein